MVTRLKCSSNPRTLANAVSWRHLQPRIISSHEVEPLKCLPVWFHGIIVENDQAEVGGVDACENRGYASG